MTTGRINQVTSTYTATGYYVDSTDPCSPSPTNELAVGLKFKVASNSK